MVRMEAWIAASVWESIGGEFSTRPRGRPSLDRTLLEVMNVEVTPLVGPECLALPARRAGHGCEGLERVLVAMLGHESFALGERNRLRADGDFLGTLADEPHFHAA